MFWLLCLIGESPSGETRNTGGVGAAFAQNRLWTVGLFFVLHLPRREQGVGEGAEFLLHKMKMPNPAELVFFTI